MKRSPVNRWIITLRYNHEMFEIRRIRSEEWPVAKRLVYRVAYDVFNETRPLEEMIAHFDSRGTLDDMHDIQRNYFDSGGIFLVTTMDGEIIGTNVKSCHVTICRDALGVLVPQSRLKVN